MQKTLQLLFPVDIQYFSDFEGGEETTESTESSVEGGEVADSNVDEGDGEVDQLEQAESTEPDYSKIDNSKAFAKRLEERTQAKLAEERQRWEQDQYQREQEYQQRLAEQENYQRATQFFLERGGYDSIEALNEAIELQRMQEQAEQHQVPLEVMQRINQLEQKASYADYLQQQQSQQELLSRFDSALSDFAKDRGVEAKELEHYMLTNQIGSFDVAYRAMRADHLEQQMQEKEQQMQQAKDIAIKEYLESKKAPRVEGSGGAPSLVTEQPASSWNEARDRAIARLKSFNTQL